MKDFTLSVVAPDRSVVEEKTPSVIVPGIGGYFGIWAGHEPLISAISAGVLEYDEPGTGNRHFVAIGGGFAEITADHVTILADTAERATDIDIADAEYALEEARKALRGEASTLSKEQATIELDRAVNRIKAARMRG